MYHYKVYKTSLLSHILLAGVPPNEQPSETERLRKKTHIPSNFNLMELEDYIASLFPRIPQLARVGFMLCKATKLRQLVPVVGTDIAELRGEIKRGRLYVRPKRDLVSMVCTFNNSSIPNLQFCIALSPKDEMPLPFVEVWLNKLPANTYVR